MNWVLLIFLLVVAFLLFIQIMKGAPFVPSSNAAINAMIELAHPAPGEKAADLGSGNGKVIIAFAQKGIEAHGFEISPVFVLWTLVRIRKLGLQDKAFVHWKSFWRTDLSEFNVVTVFGINSIMADLEKKLRKELKPGARVVSNIFEFPSWPLESKSSTVRLYVQKNGP